MDLGQVFSEYAREMSYVGVAASFALIGTLANKAWEGRRAKKAIKEQRRSFDTATYGRTFYDQEHFDQGHGIVQKLRGFEKPFNLSEIFNDDAGPQMVNYVVRIAEKYCTDEEPAVEMHFDKLVKDGTIDEKELDVHKRRYVKAMIWFFSSRLNAIMETENADHIQKAGYVVPLITREPSAHSDEVRILGFSKDQIENGIPPLDDKLYLETSPAKPYMKAKGSGHYLLQRRETNELLVNWLNTAGTWVTYEGIKKPDPKDPKKLVKTGQDETKTALEALAVGFDKPVLS